MKNKIFSIVLLVCLVLPLTIVFSGCENGLKTNVKYIISEVEIVWGSESEKTEILESEGITEQQMYEMYNNGSYFIFNNNMVTIGTDNGNSRDYWYKQDKNFISIYNDNNLTKFLFELEISEKSLIRTISDENYQTYVLLTYERK